MTDESPLLVIEDLHVNVGGQSILRGINLEIIAGDTHVLLGPNGGGKTTLLNTILGMPGYEVERGSIRFKGTELLGMEIDGRARMGIAVAFQRPPAVRGVKLRQMIEVASGNHIADDGINEIAEELNLSYMLERDVNMGFSGGEAKRSEMGQLLAQSPELALFDEPESGVDLDNIAVVGGAIHQLLKGERVSDKGRSGLIITHTGHILEFVNADIGHVLYNGRLTCQGNPRDLIDEIGEHGYEKCVECALCQ